LPPLGEAPLEGTDLIGALDAVANRLRERRIPASVPQRERARFPRRLKPLASVLTDRLQHPEPLPRAVGLHESLVDERLQLVEDVFAEVGANHLDVREGTTSGEDGQTPEQALLRVVEQRVAPVDRGAQSLLPLGNVARDGCTLLVRPFRARRLDHGREGRTHDRDGSAKEQDRCVRAEGVVS
jgi:hypothetical protein